MTQLKILTVFGTRPEVIKLAPFVKAVEADPSCVSISCATTQHRELQNDVLNLFKIKADFDLDIMRQEQDLFYVTESVLSRLNPILSEISPDFVVVQGDTTSAYAAALSAFYHKIPVVHVEAGLRTGNIYRPFPEEINRAQIGRLATFHMAPTQNAVKNLENEGITQNIFHVGNTIVDAVQMVLDMSQKASKLDEILHSSNPKVLITIHRRENFGKPLRDICQAIQSLSQQYPETTFIWPVHPNPNIKDYVTESMSSLPNVNLCDPVSYEQLIKILNASNILLSDSGGIQEEACILGKPILILRDETERPEVVECGIGKLVGADPAKIIQEFSNFSAAICPKSYANVYGVPGVSKQIVQILRNSNRNYC